MSIRPIDMQVTVAKTQELTKSNELNSDKYALQDTYKNEMQKHTDRQFTEVNKSTEIENYINENGHNNQEYDSDKKEKDEKQREEEKKEAELKEKEREEYKRLVTHRGNLFDFKA